MAICMLRYLFHIKLALPEDIGFFVQYKGNKSLVRVKTINGANISSYTNKDLSWLFQEDGNQNNNLSVLKISTNDPLEQIPLRYIHYYNNKDHFSAGVVEPTYFSIFEVSFNIPNKDFLDKEDNIRLLDNSAFDIINDFTNKYRLVSQENDIYLPRSNESPVIEIWYSDLVEQKGELISANLKPYKETVNFNGLKKLNKPILTKEKIEKLNNLLKTGSRIPLYQQLLLEAKEQGHINNNYELSVLKIGTSFEVFLKELLVNACQNIGIQKLPVGRGRDLEKLPTKNYKEAIQEGNIKEDLLKKYLKIIIGNNSILTVKEYNYWHKWAYTLRNEIVHSGRTSVSENEARMAFESTNALIILISSKVSQSLDKIKTD